MITDTAVIKLWMGFNSDEFTDENTGVIHTAQMAEAAFHALNPNPTLEELDKGIPSIYLTIANYIANGDASL